MGSKVRKYAALVCFEVFAFTMGLGVSVILPYLPAWVWFTISGVAAIAGIFLWYWPIRLPWLQTRFYVSPLTAFQELTPKDVKDLSNILWIAERDNYHETLPLLRASMAKHKHDLSRAMIQTPPVLTAKNRDLYLVKWRRVEQCLLMTVSRGKQELNDWEFVRSESRKINDLED